MKMRLIRFPAVFILLCISFLIASCQSEEPAPVAPLNPTIDQINDQSGAVIIDQPDVAPEEQPEETDVPQETPEEPSETVEDAQPDVETPQENVEDVSDEEENDSPEVGSTVLHEVQAGDWLVQIARCYGADYLAVRRANPQLLNPNWIKPGTIVSVPNVGSNGTVHGTPCVAEYTVVMGDTWLGLAEQFGTTAVILRRVNPGPLLAADTIIVPAHAVESGSE